MVLLVTSDNEQFNADKDVVERSVLIKNMLEGECRLLPCGCLLQQLFFYLLLDVGESDQPIPLPNVSSSVLKKASSALPGSEAKLTHISLRFLSTANTIAVSPCLLPTQTRAKTKRANGQRTSANGTKSLSRSIRRCSSRLFWLPTTLTSNLFCTSIPLLMKTFETDQFCRCHTVTLDARQ
jgi:hypothetical protein